MNEKTEFLEKLNGLLKLAQEQESQITIEEVKAYFSEDALTEEQIELVFEYLMAQKVVVKGYMKMTPEKRENEYTEEEKLYLKEYKHDLKAIRSASQEEVQQLYRQVMDGEENAKNRLVEVYLKEVVTIAEQLHQPEVFIGDVIQEGNLGLVLGMEKITDPMKAHETIVMQIRQSIQLLLEEQSELSSRDKKMVEKVQALDESIQALTEELGRKVTIDELAVYMGVEIEEIEDILKLTGEEPEEETKEGK